MLNYKEFNEYALCLRFYLILKKLIIFIIISRLNLTIAVQSIYQLSCNFMACDTNNKL